MGRGKRRQHKRQKQQRAALAGRVVGPEANRARAVASSASADVDIPWTAERPQPVRRAFGIFRVGRIDFIGRRKWFLLLSGALMLISVVSLSVRGMNLGIDFKGGNEYSLQFGQPVEEAQVRQVLENMGVTEAIIRVDRSDPKEAIVRTPRYLNIEAESRMLDAVTARFPGVTISAGEAVSETISRELLVDSLWATLLACVGILIYVSVRFEYRFAAAGVLALVHDALITTGAFSVLQLSVNATYVAAILTVIGFSINDTVVVFDRVRDNLKRRGKEGLEALSNRSINETFVRSVNTNITAFLAVAAVYFLGGPTTKDFALALMIGILVGSYSTICVATPIWLWWRKRDERIREAESSKALAKPKPVRG